MRNIIAMVIGGAYFVAIVILCKLSCVFQMTAGILIVLSFILYSEEWGYYTGFIGVFQPRITKRSPAWLVEAMGWVLLLMPIVVFIYQAIREILFWM